MIADERVDLVTKHPRPPGGQEIGVKTLWKQKFQVIAITSQFSHYSINDGL